VADGALSHIKVVDFTTHVAGPYSTKLLADYGADVIKVERPGTGDAARSMGPFPGDVPHPEKSGLFLHLNTNKRSITLNLKSVAGRNIAGRHYETAKAALVQFTRATAVDWAPMGITVNAICPGGFMTEPNLRWAKSHPEVISSFRAMIPMGDHGQPEDLGPLAVYLASDASRYMTGASLVIDGGYTLC